MNIEWQDWNLEDDGRSTERMIIDPVNDLAVERHNIIRLPEQLNLLKRWMGSSQLTERRDARPLWKRVWPERQMTKDRTNDRGWPQKDGLETK